MRDPFPKVAGGGFERLREAEIVVKIATDDEAKAARRLNAPYLKRLATGMPYVIAKWAMTVRRQDGGRRRRQPLDHQRTIESRRP